MKLTILALTACTAALLTCNVLADNEKKADVIHWFTSEGEAKAIKVFADAFNAAGGTWVDAAVAGHDPAIAAASTRIQAGDPPAAVVYNSLKDIEDMIDGGYFADIDSVASAEHWQQNMPAAMYSAVTHNGHVYGVPINLGVNNYLWSSPIALQKIGMSEPPKTWDEFFAAGDKLKAAGIIPFAQSGKWYWYLNSFGEVLATQSIDAYNKFHALDASVFAMPEYKKAVEIFARLREYADDGVPGREWNLSNAMVMRGEAAFELMGDWVKGEVLAAGKVPGKDLLCTVAVDNSPVSISGDIVAFPKNKDKTTYSAQALLAKVMATPATQLAYANAKGSMPVRTDVDSSGFDTCAKVALSQQKVAGSVSGYPVLLAPDAAGSLADVLGNFWVDSSASAEDLTAQLTDEFSILQ